MEIIVGKSAGFCFGAKRAVDGALELSKDRYKTYCLGEIVHNGNVIKKLEDNGVVFIEDLYEVEDNATVIIRAHGISKEVYETAQKRNIKLVDYTCPFVDKIHKIVEEYSNNNFYIFLVGSKTHPETIGTSSYCGNHYKIIESIDDVEDALNDFNNSGLKKALLIVQTTYSLEKFESIKNKLVESLEDNTVLQVNSTICNTTKIRQDEVSDMSKNVDCMIIIGGKNSSNTKKLYDISIKNCKNTYLIEDAYELNIDEIKKFNVVGIMAGASTPYESIEDTIKLLK